MTRQLWLLGVVAAVTPSAGFACDPAQLDHANAALAADRLIQVERMIAGLRPSCGSEDRYRRLSGQWALRVGRYDQAFALFSELLQRAPDDWESLSGAGRAAFNLGRVDQAYDYLIRASAQPGADWRTWNALAVLHDQRYAWEASAEAYRRALALSDRSASIWNNRGYSLMLQRRFPEAASDLDRAVALDPNNPIYRTNRDLAHAMAGQYAQRRRGESRREWGRRLNNMGYAAWLAGNREAARSLLARAIEESDVAMGRAEANLNMLEGSND